MSWEHTSKQHAYTTGIGAGLRREPEPGETLVRCVACGRYSIPLNERETWHYVRTGEGLCSDCPRYLAATRGQPPCKWEPVA